MLSYSFLLDIAFHSQGQEERRWAGGWGCTVEVAAEVLLLSFYLWFPESPYWLVRKDLITRVRESPHILYSTHDSAFIDSEITSFQIETRLYIPAKLNLFVAFPKTATTPLPSTASSALSRFQPQTNCHGHVCCQPSATRRCHLYRLLRYLLFRPSPHTQLFSPGFRLDDAGLVGRRRRHCTRRDETSSPWRRRHADIISGRVKGWR
jgi:hypothetical protein